MYKAVVIEDEPNVRKELVLCSPWDSEGIIFAGEAEDGKSGLELIFTVHPDIVLTDIRMPNIDGIEMIKLAKEKLSREENSIHAEPEWIIISGYSEFEYAHNAMQLGVHEYVLKPVQDEELKQSLERCKKRIDEKRFVRNVRSAADKGGRTIQIFREYKSNGDDINGYISKAVELIRNNYVQGITMEDVASKLGISSGHFSRLFRKATGYTFTDYLMYERIVQAVKLLKETDKKVYEIADLVGYEDGKYFSQIFKRITGFTPLEFKAL